MAGSSRPAQLISTPEMKIDPELFLRQKDWLLRQIQNTFGTAQAEADGILNMLDAVTDAIYERYGEDVFEPYKSATNTQYCHEFDFTLARRYRVNIDRTRKLYNDKLGWPTPEELNDILYRNCPESEWEMDYISEQMTIHSVNIDEEEVGRDESA